MSTTVAPSISVSLDGTPMAPKLLDRVRSIDVEIGVGMQGGFKIRLAIGQSADGDWPDPSDQTLGRGSRVAISAQLGGAGVPIITGMLTEYRMNFTADPCSSELELTGADDLELLSRQTERRGFENQTLSSIVNQIFSDSQITTPPASETAQLETYNPKRDVIMQSKDSLSLMRALGARVDAEVYVEPSGFGSAGHFTTLTFPSAPSDAPMLNINQGRATNVQNAQFYYDLSGFTAVEAQFMDASGNKGPVISRALYDNASNADKIILGPPALTKKKHIEGSGLESQQQLEKLCDAEIRRASWLVVAKGELDTATYGGILIPRRVVNVNGASSAFSGPFMVWRVTHSIGRELYCQKFELRRPIGGTS